MMIIMMMANRPASGTQHTAAAQRNGDGHGDGAGATGGMITLVAQLLARPPARPPPPPLTRSSRDSTSSPVAGSRMGCSKGRMRFIRTRRSICSSSSTHAHEEAMGTIKMIMMMVIVKVVALVTAGKAASSSSILPSRTHLLRWTHAFHAADGAVLLGHWQQSLPGELVGRHRRRAGTTTTTGMRQCQWRWWCVDLLLHPDLLGDQLGDVLPVTAPTPVPTAATATTARSSTRTGWGRGSSRSSSSSAGPF